MKSEQFCGSLFCLWNRLEHYVRKPPPFFFVQVGAKKNQKTPKRGRCPEPRSLFEKSDAKNFVSEVIRVVAVFQDVKIPLRLQRDFTMFVDQIHL